MSEALRMFVGVDPRQPLAYSVLQSSIHRHAKGRVIVEPLMLGKLPITRRGLTEFTYSRFLVPWLCDYTGHAVFMDADVVVVRDIADLFAQADGVSAVQVMQEQARYEWASVMLFDCARCEVLTPEYVENPAHDLLSLNWGKVGTFPPWWNHCVGYAEPDSSASLYHYTQGLPCWHETQDFYRSTWTDERDAMLETCDWAELMAKSIHAKPVIKRMLARYGIQVGEK